jgi:hypothetical protein
VPVSDVPVTADVITPPDQLCVFSAPSPFLAVATVIILVRCTFDHLGLVFESDPMSYRNIIVDVVPHCLASHLDWQHLLQFHTVIQIGQTAVFTVSEILSALSFVDSSTHDSVSLIVAPYRPGHTDQQAPLPQIALDQLHIVNHILHGWTLSDPVLLLTATNASNMAHGKKLTRRVCLKGSERAMS